MKQWQQYSSMLFCNFHYRHGPAAGIWSAPHPLLPGWSGSLQLSVWATAAPPAGNFTEEMALSAVSDCWIRYVGLSVVQGQ
jgi:hypothetical protein